MNWIKGLKVGMVKGIAVTLLLVMGVFFSCQSVYGAENQKSTTHVYSVGLRLGYGESFDTGKSINAVAVMPYFQWSFYEHPLNDGTLFDLGLVVEPVFFYYNDPEDAIGVGITPRLRFDLRVEGMTPYLEAGVGVFWTNLEVRELGQELNFTPQGEIGVQFPVYRNFAVNLGYRFHHISNAGLNENNAGVNSHMFVIGLGVYF